MTWEYFQSEILPYFLVITKGYGLTIEDIEWSCPTDMLIYEKAYELEEKKIDERNWYLGMYIYEATYTAIGHNFGNKQAKYPDKPYSLQEHKKTLDEMTPEELDAEIRKAALQQQQWSAQVKASGAEETVI